MIEHVDEHLWLVEGDLVSFYGFPYNTRSVIVELQDKTLWVWSPVKLTDDIRAFIGSRTVAHLVSPNPIHHLFLQEWKEAYPAAKLWGPASTIAKRQDLVFESPALQDDAPADWANEIEQFWIHGSVAMDEIVFFHKPSRTAILADLSENFTQTFLEEHWGWLSRQLAYVWKITEPYGYAPLEWRWSWKDKASDRQKLEMLIKRDPEKVIMAHGQWQPTNGAAYLKNCFAWIL